MKIFSHMNHLSTSNGIRYHNHLVRKQTLPNIWRLLRTRSCWTFSQTIECRFTLNPVRDMIITYTQMNHYQQILDRLFRLHTLVGN